MGFPGLQPIQDNPAGVITQLPAAENLPGQVFTCPSSSRYFGNPLEPRFANIKVLRGIPGWCDPVSLLPTANPTISAHLSCQTRQRPLWPQIGSHPPQNTFLLWGQFLSPVNPALQRLETGRLGRLAVLSPQLSKPSYVFPAYLLSSNKQELESEGSLPKLG